MSDAIKIFPGKGLSPEKYFSQDELEMYEAVMDWKELMGQYPDGPPVLPAENTSADIIAEWDRDFAKVMAYINNQDKL